MGKLIALIVSVVILLAGIVLLALGKGIGLLLLIVGILAILMMAFIIGSRGFFSHPFTPRGFFEPTVKTKIDEPSKDQPMNVWDKMTETKDKK